MEPRRLPTAVLLIVVAVALAAGAWWWRGAAPQGFAAKPSPSPSETVPAHFAGAATELGASLYEVEGREVVRGKLRVMQPEEDAAIGMPALDGIFRLRVACVGQVGESGEVRVSFIEHQGDVVRGVNRDQVFTCGEQAGFSESIRATDRALTNVEMRLDYSGSGEVLVGWVISDVTVQVPEAEWSATLAKSLPAPPDAVDVGDVDLGISSHGTKPLSMFTPGQHFDLRFVCLGTAVLNVGLESESSSVYTTLPCNGVPTTMGDESQNSGSTVEISWQLESGRSAQLRWVVTAVRPQGG